MTELSPATQAVLDAFLKAPCDNKLSVAAALRAAADQVVPPAVILEYYERNESPVLGKAIEVRNKLLAIAAELRGTTLHGVRSSNKEAARQFLYEAGFTDKEGNLRPPYCSEEP